MKQRAIFCMGVILFFGSVAAYPQETAGRQESKETTPAAIQSLFPMEQDFSWRYERISKEGVSHYTTSYRGSREMDGHTYHILSNPYGVSYYISSPDFLKIGGMVQNEDVNKVNFYEEGDIVRLKTPLASGNRWQGRAVLEKEEDVIITAYHTEILGWEKVTVPAGDFDSIVTSSTQHTIFIKKKTGVGRGMLTFEQAWYSPGTGMVRRDMHLLYPGDVRVPLRDDRLEEFIRKKK
ncbi:hypothetical protein JW926_14965 [Candidatus Sumerlaeota bacterium]|nr:hypothetical protein [Candidatus Sumerlaeota bacterium]